MILMNDQFLGNPRLQEFTDWKAQKGYDVSVVTTSMIDSSGAPSNEQIVSFMNGLSAQQYPRYLLIIGDADATHGVAPYKTQSQAVAVQYSDWFAYPQYYTDRFITSKNPSGLPTVFAGRLPASDTAELTVMLDKVLLMDRTPPDPATSSMYNQVVVAGEIWPDPQPPDGKYFDRGAFAEIQDAAETYFEQRGDGFPYGVSSALVVRANTTYVEGSSIYWNPSQTRLWKDAVGTDQVIGQRVLGRYLTGPDAEANALQAVLARANAGVAMLLYIGSADTNGWGHPPFVSAEITSKLQNGTNLPLVISDAGLAGTYYPPTGNPQYSPGEPFVKSLLTHSNGGAYAVIGATELIGITGITHGLLMAFLSNYREWLASSTDPKYPTPLPAPDTQAIGLKAGEATRLGPMLYFAQWYLDGDYTYQLFGDPEAFVVLHPPLAQKVSYPIKMAPGPSRSFTISTGEDGAKVSLYSQALGLPVVGVTQNGTVTLPIAASAEGTINVTVTKYERMPFRGTLTVTSNIPKGDVDGNGTIDVVDAQRIASYVAGNPTYNLIREAADVDCDGAITQNDALLVTSLWAGSISAFPCH